MPLDLPRRDFLRGLLAVAAPAIVHSANIMPVKALLDPIVEALEPAWEVPPEVFTTDNLLVKDFERYSCDLLLPGLQNVVSRYKTFPPMAWEDLFNS